MNISKQFKENPFGHLVPLDRIKPADLDRDAIVIEIMTKAEELAGTVSAFKKRSLADLQAFAELAGEKYGAKLGGKKGNLTLISYDGRYKIVRAIADRIEFNESLQAAKSLIDECLTEWTKDARTEIQSIIHSAFEADTKGNLATHKILGLRSIKIEDPKWKRAMEAIADAITVTSSKTYLRFYVRNSDGQYIQLRLDPTEL